MASRGLRVCTLLSLFPIVFAFLPGGGFGNGFAQAPDKRISVSRKAREGNRPYSWDDLSWSWNQRGGGCRGGNRRRNCGYGLIGGRWRCGRHVPWTHPSRAWVRHPLPFHPHRHPRVGWLWGRLLWHRTLRAMGCRITTGFRGELLRWRSIRPMARETRCFWAELMEGFGGRRTRGV